MKFIKKIFYLTFFLSSSIYSQSDSNNITDTTSNLIPVFTTGADLLENGSQSQDIRQVLILVLQDFVSEDIALSIHL